MANSFLCDKLPKTTRRKKVLYFFMDQRERFMTVVRLEKMESRQALRKLGETPFEGEF